LKNLFNHHSYLTNGTDIIANLDEFLDLNNDIENFSNKKNNINDATFGQKIEVDSNKGGYFNNIFQGIVIFFSELFTAAKNIIGLVIFLIIAYYLLKIFFKCYLYVLTV
jgi:predicted PurR-regulated permease PerM